MTFKLVSAILKEFCGFVTLGNKYMLKCSNTTLQILEEKMKLVFSLSGFLLEAKELFRNTED